MLSDWLGLAGRGVLISGAGGGIGRALVGRFAAAGARVTGADLTLDAMTGLELTRRLAFDQTDATATRAALAALEDEEDFPRILIVNAGYTRGETLAQTDAAVWEREIAINLTGSQRVAAAIIDGMARRGGGSVVFIASVNALAHYGNPAYSAAKAGLVAYAKAVAVERGAVGVRAIVICPGSVRTPAWDHRLARDPELMSRVLPHYPLGRLVTPDEVAAAALFLGSDAASGITGAVLTVDAGLTAGNRRFFTDVIEGA